MRNFIKINIYILWDSMDEYEFQSLLYSGKYLKLARIINKNPKYVEYLKKYLTSKNEEDYRRALILLKRLNKDIQERYIKYIVKGLNHRKIIKKESISILKILTNSECEDDAIIKCFQRYYNEALPIYLKNLKKDNIYYRAFESLFGDFDTSFKNICINYKKLTTFKLLEKLYSNDVMDRDIAIELLIRYIDYLDKNIIKKNLHPILLGEENIKIYKNIKKLFNILDVNVSIDIEELKNLFEFNEKKALNIVIRENIKFPEEFYNKEFLKNFLYNQTENKQFVGVKLVSLMDNSEKKADLLFKFLIFGYGKAKTSAIRELKKMSKDRDLKDYIKNKVLKYLKGQNLSLKISSLRILKEVASKDIIDILLDEHKKLLNLMNKLEEEKFMGGFKHLLMMEEEIRKCKIAMRIIEEIIANICLDDNIHYESLNISQKLGYELYITMSYIGEKNINLIDKKKFISSLKTNWELIYYISKIIKNLDEEDIEEIIKILDIIKIEDSDILNANKIRIYTQLKRVDKIGEILNLAIGYHSYLALIDCILEFYKLGLLSDEDIKLIMPKIVDIISTNSKMLRRKALKLLELCPSSIFLPTLIIELKYGDKDIILKIIEKIINNEPETIYKFEKFLNSENKKSVLEIFNYLSKKYPNLLEDFIYILALKYEYFSNDERELIKNILKNISKENYNKFIHIFK